MKTLTLLAVFASLSFGQNYFDLTKPFSIVPNQPGTCKYGAVIIRSDLTVGSNVYMCGLSNNWVALGTGGLATPISITNGGTGTSTTLVGLIRGNASALTAAELSGDCTTSGSNAIVCTKTNGASFAASATTDTTSATNISSGTLNAARLPSPSASTLGGIESIAPASHKVIGSISTSGVPSQVQLASADLNDQTNTPALAPGDATVDVTSNVFTDEASATSTTTISVGQTVSWKWVSGLHVVVSLSGFCSADPCAPQEDQRFDSGDPTSSVGHRFTYTFTAPGTYHYYCDVHGQMMQGTVVVVQTATLHTPTTSSEPCTVNQIAYDSSFVYICTAPTTWVRAVLGSF